MNQTIKRPKMLIYLDFDGTVVEHQYPLIGSYNTGCIEVVDKLFQAGHEIVINTMRAELDENLLMEAVEFINEALSTLNSHSEKYTLLHTDSKYYPTQWDWNLHFKTNRIFIDDVCDGIPLKEGISTNRPMVDWDILNIEFEERGLFKKID